MARVLLFSILALVHAEPQNEVKAQPLHCITCAAQQVTCMATAINQCKEQHACDTVMNASSCVSCVGAANCGSDPACSDCLNQLETVADFKKLIANASKEELIEASQEPKLLLSTARCSEPPSLMKTCGTRCHSSSNIADCAANCLRGVGVQSSCASCFGRKIQCSVRNCMRSCSGNSNSPACKSCVSRSCSNCNSEKSMEPSEESESALAALSRSQLESSLSTARCSEPPSLMKTCGTRCHSSSNIADCAANCLRGVGVQSSCASCFGRKIQCSVRNCMRSCSGNSNSPACKSCVSRSCSNCNSEKSMEPSEESEEYFMSAIAALAQSEAEQQPTVFP